jgi:ribosomal small subunit protein bTHX
MGKGDKKTVRGKIIIGSYGAKRKKKRTPAFDATAPETAKKVIPAKVEAEKPVAKVEKKVVAKADKPEVKKKTPAKPKVDKEAEKE